nr:MAG TPA: hypothetical protein [Caudoviricetes sp.]
MTANRLFLLFLFSRNFFLLTDEFMGILSDGVSDVFSTEKTSPLYIVLYILYSYIQYRGYYRGYYRQRYHGLKNINDNSQSYKQL